MDKIMKSEDLINQSKNGSFAKDLRFKLVLIGSFGVGKTSLMLRHFEKYFTNEPKTTVGVDFRQKKVQLNNNSVILEVWDTAGEEKYANIVQIYYRGAHAVVAVYDLTNRLSFTKALKYIEDVLTQAIPPIVVALIGNKKDLNYEREVTYEEAVKHALNNNLLYIETSAKSDKNVDHMFETIVEKLMEIVINRQIIPENNKQIKINSIDMKTRHLQCCMK